MKCSRNLPWRHLWAVPPSYGWGIMKRYFEFTGADADRGTSNSAKFWEVDVEGSMVKVHFGKIGATGQTTVKDFDSYEAARAHAENLTAEKTTKGCAERSAG